MSEEEEKNFEGTGVVVTPVDVPSFDEFVGTIAALRDPSKGCPWDRVQTHRSIAKNMIEEAYEAVDAIEADDVEHMREELGDVLLQVVLQCQIAADAGEFSIEDVAHDVNAKMVRRHPHVFGVQKAFASAGLDPASVQTADDVLPMWDRIKLHEKELKAQARAKRLAQQGLDPDEPQGLLDDVPSGQPALMQATEVSKKTVRVGFEWDSTEDVWRQVDSEIAEFKACEPGSDDAVLEMGDILFSLVNVARRESIDAETALRRACGKFRSRWSMMEREARGCGEDITSLSTERLNELWRNAKAREKSEGTEGRF